MITCVEKNCNATVKADNKWETIKAHNAGWYFRRDGTVHCPDHRPSFAPKLGADPREVK